MTIAELMVAVDFSEESDLARQHAVALAKRTGASLTLAHAMAVPEHVLPADEEQRGNAEVWVRRRFETAKDALERLRRRTEREGVRTSKVFIDDYPEMGIAEATGDLETDVVMLGTHGHTGLKRFFLGSVAERTVRLAQCDVIVARGAPPEGGYRRVLVPTDFSADAERALARAIDLAADDAVIELFHAWGFYTGGVVPVAEAGPGSLMVTSLTKTAEEMGAGCMKRHRTPRVNLRYEHRRTSPMRGIEDRIEVLEPDLIAVGTHGRRGFKRLLLGSVAETTVRHAPCTVLVAGAKSE